MTQARSSFVTALCQQSKDTLKKKYQSASLS
uniref:Uncharacterized protein n=1 Tax=Anguilla anguilla TaxID=7936 RepID=A0A0E9VMI6_ANGAN